MPHYFLGFARNDAAGHLAACCQMAPIQCRARRLLEALRNGNQLRESLQASLHPEQTEGFGGIMKFDLLYEMETPRPWNERSEYNIYWQALEQIELADRLGFNF